MFFRRGEAISLRHRVMVSVLAVAIAIIGLAGFVHGLLLEHMAHNFLRQRLQAEADYLSSQVVATTSGTDKTATGAALLAPDGHHIFAVYRNGHALDAANSWSQVLKQTLQEPAGQLLTIHAPEFDLVAFRRQISLGPARLDLVVAENVRELDQDTQALHWWVAGVSFLLLVVLVILLMIAIRLAFLPVARLGRQLAGLQRGERHRLEPQGAREVDELGDQVNQLLEALDQRLARSRTALANLSHALKTPLTALLGILDSEEPIDPDTRSLLVERLRGIHQQVENELRRARLAGPSVGMQCQPVIQAKKLVRLCRTLYPDNRITYSWDLDDRLTFPIESQDFNELLGNILDNACKWSRLEVRLEMTWAAASGFRVSVEDDGPGVEPKDREALGQRGLRLDEQVPGHGLGLSIVRDLIERYQGELHFTTSAIGGLRAELTFPSFRH